MFWADRVAKEIINSGKYKPYLVDDMKTPSGQIHVGALRGVLVHDFIYKALKHRGVDAKFTYVFEDHDPLDEISHNLNRDEWSKYLGQPLFTVPSPDGNSNKNFAQYFSYEFKEAFNIVGADPEIIWVSDLYKSGKMNEGVKKCLDKADVIREIYEELYKKPLPKDWYPFKIVCPKCGKEVTTNVTDWDGEEVTFTCEIHRLDWVKGCGFSGKASPFSGDGKYAGKLPWKVEWPLKWQVIGVTVEGAGKDHMSAGGSHDVAKLVCERVLKYPVPFPLAYEFFLLGGRKMSSSKGIGSSAIEIVKVLPPELARFLFARTDYRQQVNFDSVGTMAVPDLFDEYDRCFQAYISFSDETLARTFEMSQIGELPRKEKTFLPRFRDVVNFIQQLGLNSQQKFGEIKGSSLNEEELHNLKEREKYAKIWLENYAPSEFKLGMSRDLPEVAKNLDKDQKIYITKVIEFIEKDLEEDELQQKLYELSKEMGINSKKAFSALYIALIGKEFGPKAGAFLRSLDKKKVVARLKEAIKNN